MTTGIKNDSGKRQWWYLDSFWPDLEDVVSVLEYGDSKYYAPDGSNWKRLENPEKRFNDALFRHMVAYRQGEKIDSETGKSHLAHLITNALILMYFDRANSEEKKYDPETLNKALDIVQEVRDSIYLGNSPYTNNEDIVNPYLDAVSDELQYILEGRNKCKT